MSGYTVTKKRKGTDFNHILFSIALILLFASFLSPLFVLMPVQDVLYTPTDHWFFSPPRTAFVVLILSIVILAVLIFIKVWLDSNELFKGKFKLAIYIMGIISLIFIFLAINQYRYVNGDGIHINPLFGFSEKHYAWSDIEKAQQTVDGGKVTFDFVFKNGDTYSMLLNEDERKSWKLLLFTIEEQGLKVKYIQKES
ncbi:hypothetical protein ACFSO7_17665 [Bacillus sp. CGMCC 1.16607]|uniref:hypothetical protein n=1 Tax=Bacillus sp. CGMCC 1.16607 TaxID=3351842 RepID=UPI003644A05F